MNDKEKVIALYNYIAEVSKSFKDTKINVTEEKWFSFFDDFLKHQDIIFDYKNLGKDYFENEENRFLEIKKPTFLKPLFLDENLLKWLEGDWKDYKSTLAIKEEIINEELEEEIKEKGLHPLNKKEADDFLRKFIHRLSSSGYFLEDEEIENLKEEDILIEDKPLIFIRKKDTGIVKAIESIVDRIEKYGEIPNQLLELVGIINNKEDSKKNNSIENIKEEEILFVKDTNREQVDIAKQIEINDAVVVQGPPGTGKTHTIANLLGHFLAQGKNVLITSHTKKALRVLKEKIPKNIQGLCISILDDENIKYIDHRIFSGLLWVMYDEDKKEIIENFFKKNNYNYFLEKRGTLLTSGKAAWRIKNL